MSEVRVVDAVVTVGWVTLTVGWVTLLVLTAATAGGCGAEAAAGEDCPPAPVAIVLEYNDLAEPCIEAGLPAPGCCPDGFYPVGLQGAAVVCLGQ